MRNYVPITLVSVAGLYALALALLPLAFDLKIFAFVILFITLGGVLTLPLDWALVLLFGYIGIEGCLKIFSAYHPMIHIGADIISIILCVKAVLAAILLRRGSPTKRPPFTRLLMVHFGWFIIAFFNPYAISLYASAAGAKVYVTMVILFFFGYYASRSLKDINKFMVVWMAVVFFHSLFGIYQSSLGPSSVLSIHPGYQAPLLKLQGYAFRPFGLTALPGGPSVFIFLTMPFLVYVLTGKFKGAFRMLAGTALLLAVVTLFLCQVRSAIIKSIFGVGTYFALSMYSGIRINPAQRVMNYRMVFAMVGVLVFAIPFALNQVTSQYSDNVRAIERSMSSFEYSSIAVARQGSLDRFLMMVQEVPLGAGLSRTGAASGKFQDAIREGEFFAKGFFTDNFWLATLVDLGIPGMVLLTTIVAVFLLYGFRQVPRFFAQRYALAHIAILASLASSAIGFYGAESILYNPEACFFWFFSGVLMKIPELDAQAHAEEFNPEGTLPHEYASV